MNTLTSLDTAPCRRSGAGGWLSRRSTLVMLLLLMTAAIVLQQQVITAGLKTALRRAQEQGVGASTRASALAAELESAQSALKEQQAALWKAQSTLAAEERKVTASHPEWRWALPPAQWPEWNPESPYVWMRKDALPMFSVPVFERDGSLVAPAAAVLAVDPATAQLLNESTRRILAQYRDLEQANTRLRSEPLPGIPTGDGSVTIEVTPLPDGGARLRQSFEMEVRRVLGAQRGDLVVQTSEGWLRNQFAAAGDQPTVISAARNSDNTYNVSIQSSAGWMSVGGIPRLDDYVPAHLRSFFSSMDDSKR